MTRRTATLCALALLLSAGAAAGAAQAPIAVTRDGPIRGTVTASVERYLGIPYARPPTGRWRWRPPQPPARWRSIRGASSAPPSCTQPFPVQTFGPYTHEFVDTPAPSEDCLYLNVWTASRVGRRPVFVWIHGGAFLGGSGLVPIYDGAALAARDVVVVTINYRVGPFGFLAHPALSLESRQHISGNYGLQDQVAALRWVRRNISRFGGDPANVTIAGQSAGAISVDDLLAVRQANGLYHRAIAQSGSGMGVMAPSLAQAEEEGRHFAEYLGVRDAAALRALPPETIQAAVHMPLAPSATGPQPPAIRFRPIVDGVWLRADPAQPGGPVKLSVPLLTGFNADEAFGPPATDTAPFVEDIGRRYGVHANAILDVYPHADALQARDSAILAARDRYMTALVLWAQRRVQPGAAPLWLYRYDHEMPVAAPQSFGAFHTAEVPYVFGNLDGRLRPYTADDEAVQRIVQGYWINFMNSGDPNRAGLPRWSRLAALDRIVMHLDAHSSMGPAVSSEARFDALRGFQLDGGLLGFE